MDTNSNTGSGRTAVRVLAWGAAGVVGVAALTGVAGATSQPGQQAAPAAAAAAPAAVLPAAVPGEPGARPAAAPAAAGIDAKAGHRRQLAGRRALHGEFVMRAKEGFRTVRVQRGEVTEVGENSITVKSLDGYTATWNVEQSTRVRKAGKQVEVGDIKVGDRAFARGQKPTEGATVAVVLRAHTPKPKATGSAG